MKKAALIAICLVAVIAVAAGQELMPDEELRQLRAENNMLKAQVKALKRRLAEATGKATTGPASRPTPGTRPAVKPTVKPTVGPTIKTEPGGTAFTVTLYEDNPKWWIDVRLFAKEVATRQVIGQLEPKYAVGAWLGHNKWFIGKDVKWKLKVSRREALTKTMAGERYFKTLNNKEAIEKRMATYKSGKRGAKEAESEAIRVARATARRQIRQFEAEAAQYKVLMDGDGGALVTGNIVKPASITVTAAVPGGQKMVAGKEVDISGTIANAVAGATSVSRYSGSSRYTGSRVSTRTGSVLVALIAR
ncbi:MAG: hypothetical protein ISS78_04225 [Phycisphaerae bacterium]|nr:hypothetical protein [Phycisphaerae bacterium]